MYETLSQLPYFSDLPGEVLSAVEARSEKHELASGVTIIQEGDAAHSMYFLANGAVKVIRVATNETLDTLSAPTLFGEMALVADMPRLATVITEGPCVVFEVRKDDVNALSQYAGLRKTVLAFHRHRLMSNILRSNVMFAPIGERHRTLMAKSFVSQTVAAGHVFLSEGQPGLGLFVVLRGNCEVVRLTEDRVVTRLGEGDIFGEISLVLFDQVCTATVRASSDCVVLFLDREIFQQTMMSNPTVREEVIKLALERQRANEGDDTSTTHLI
jgi:cAMP-dependent protein kinase regulator